MLRRQEEYQVHDGMDDIARGKITILGPRKVRKKLDGIIPLIARRLKKKKYKVRLIEMGCHRKLITATTKAGTISTRQTYWWN
jgi:hypothetical protein